MSIGLSKMRGWGEMMNEKWGLISVKLLETELLNLFIGEEVKALVLRWDARLNAFLLLYKVEYVFILSSREDPRPLGPLISTNAVPRSYLALLNALLNSRIALAALAICSPPFEDCFWTMRSGTLSRL
jgi:hypothetical protein